MEYHKKLVLSLVLGLWYVVAPYQLMNLFVRGALGEYLFLAQLPWLLWLLKMTVHKNNRWAKVGLAVTLTTSLLSHAVSLGFYIPVLGAWWLLLVKDKGIQALREGIEAVSMAALLSAFYWMPLVLELPFVETAGNEALEGFWQRFLSLRELIWSNWSYGGFVEETAGSMFTLTVGAAGWLFVIASLATLLKRRIRSLGGWVFLVIFGMAVFVTSQPSADLWRLVPVLAILQFPWRLLGVTVIASMMTLALSYRTSNPLPLLSKLLVGLAVVFIGYDFTFHAHPIGQFENPDIEWREYPGTGSSYDEFKSAGFDRHRNLALTEDLIFKADLKESTWQGASELPLAKEVWHGSRKRFKVNLNEPAYAIFKTMYFPGWQAWVDGREVEIIADDSLLPGRVIVPLLGGEQTVELMVGEHTQARQAGDGLTILGLVWVVGSLSWEIKKKVRVDEAD